MSLPDLERPLALLEQQDVDPAVDLLEEKVTKIPAHVTAHLLLARAYEAQGRWEEALDEWEHVHFLVPNSPVAGDGKRRVLRHVDETDDGNVAVSDTDPTEIVPDEIEDVDEPMTEESEEDEPEGPSSVQEAYSEGIEQLRQQAEREARQEGLPTDLSSPEAPSTPSPEEQVEKLEEEADTSDLDQLIDELESARIEPDPDAEGAPEPDFEDDAEDVVSETLARIHANQGNYQEAARIYERLAEEEPDRAQEFEQKADDMRAQTQSGGQGD